MSKANWIKIVYVKEAPLMLDGVGLRHGRTDEILDQRFSIKDQSYLYLDGDIYYEDTEVRNYEKFINKHVGNLDPIFRLIYKIGKRFAEQESKFIAQELKLKTNRQLAQILKKYCDDYQNVLSTLYIPAALDQVLSRKIRKYISQETLGRENEIFNSLTPLRKKHDVIKYHEELLSIALHKKDQRKKLAKLVRKYAFLGIKFYLGRPLDLATCLKHLKEIKHPFSEVKQKGEIKSLEQLALKEALKLLEPSELTRKQIAWLQETIFMRTWRLERISEGENNSFVLLREVGKRLGVAGRDMIWLRFKEIADALSGKRKITSKDLQTRKKPYGMISVNYKTRFYFGKDYKQFAKRFKFSVSNAQEVKGHTAFPGLVRGRVRIIRTDDEMHKIKKGEILVTRMTTPDYIFAMRTSGAVVTDVGGVTSHASVVSRELGKPCVIGTVYATQVFKTGDLVEVDAQRGIVKLLKKAK